MQTLVATGISGANVVMMTDQMIVTPGLRFGQRPERERSLLLEQQRWQHGVDTRIAHWVSRLNGQPVEFAQFDKTYNAIAEKIETCLTLTNKQLCLQTQVTLQLSSNEGNVNEPQSSPTIIVYLLAVSAVHAIRQLGLTPHKEQIYAAWALCYGVIVDMQTGEGKSLTAALSAMTMALRGVPVHVISVNEYLVTRDARKFQAFMQAAELSCAAVLAQQEDTVRRAAYAANVVYVTSKQLTFDYLRDTLANPYVAGSLNASLSTLIDDQQTKPLQRGLCFAIIDEIDSVLVDDARTPLVLAQKKTTEDGATIRAEIVVALSIARQLEQPLHFNIQTSNGSVWINPEGQIMLRSLAEKYSGVWQFERYRGERVRQALIAMHAFQLDRDYIVRDGAVLLVDESTGRVLPDRRLQQGLHQFLEILHRCDVTDDNQVRASVSFQAFFMRYHILAGMSGSVLETRTEMRRYFDARIVVVPPHKQSQRKSISAKVFSTREQQLAALPRLAANCAKSGRALLIGTRSVQHSAQVSGALQQNTVPHQVLSATNDSQEAQKISRAGVAGAITVATNMAGRGTDIPLDDDVSNAGGLHVVSLAVNDSARVDKQLFGRAGRQGDQGSCCHWVALDDPAVVNELPSALISLIGLLACSIPFMHPALSFAVRRTTQWCIERRHQRQRRTMFKNYMKIENRLGIGTQRKS